MEITFLQTSDATKYKPIFDDTSRTVALYCHLHSYTYRKFVGIKKGVAPVCAAFNRVFLLNEMIDEGYRSWVCYLDADAFIVDFRFDTTKYLVQNASHAFIASHVPVDPRKWAVNNGVFFINLGHTIAHKICRIYLSRVLQLVPPSFWEDEHAGWPPAEFDDQNILYTVLAMNSDILENMKREQRGIFNDAGRHDSFIAQALRAEFEDFPSRCRAVRQKCNQAINEFVRITNPFLAIP